MSVPLARFLCIREDQVSGAIVSPLTVGAQDNLDVKIRQQNICGKARRQKEPAAGLSSRAGSSVRH